MYKNLCFSVSFPFKQPIVTQYICFCMLIIPILKVQHTHIVDLFDWSQNMILPLKSTHTHNSISFQAFTYNAMNVFAFMYLVKLLHSVASKQNSFSFIYTFVTNGGIFLFITSSSIIISFPFCCA